MTRFELALQRFSTALDGLDAAVDARAEKSRLSEGAMGEMTVLTAERERLLARIAELEEESRHLADVSQEVEGRLDGAIAEIRSALGRN